MKDQLIKDYLLNLWHWKMGLPEKPIFRSENLHQLERTVMHEKFIQLMRNRMVMGALRYGKKSAGKYDVLGKIEGKIKQYRETGNDELLVDVANYAMLEFDLGTHPNKHFEAKDDEDHAKPKKD